MRTLIIAFSGTAAFALLFHANIMGNKLSYAGAFALAIVAIVATATDRQNSRKNP
jgi:hypothetical protein